MQIYDDITKAIGNTPLVRLNSVTRGVQAQIVAKLEYMNPGGSVKDRVGLKIIEDAEAKGMLKPGGTVVEATSGNTGVGLAIAAALRGYKTVFVMPDKMSQEKIQFLRAFGARVVVTPTNVEPDDPESYYSVARRIAEETPNAILANQYHNPANPQTHVEMTGPEIWEQTGGKIDVFVAGVGTGGTITGVGRYLKEMNPDIKIVGVDAVGSVLYDHFKTGEIVEAHGYKIEGIGEDFLPSTYDHTVLDDMVRVADKESFLMTRRLVREEGIFAGVSSGSAVLGAIRYALQAELGPDSLVVVLLPDSGGRYLSKVYNDDWMRENQMLEPAWAGASVATLLDKKPSHQLVVARCDASIGDVIEQMRMHGISQIPVVDEHQQLLGIVEEVNLLKKMLTAENGTDVTSVALCDTDVISDDPVTVSPETQLETLMHIFTVHSVAIVKSDGKPSDIVTKFDLIDFLARV
ncbi:MAG: cystathionine beta-synthase [Chloroflexi bacterium]|nr:cystathionine beta-synthase [Chloroflexota bacterium]